MDPLRLTGFVYPVKKNGVPVRGRWQLWVNLPSEPAFDRDGQPVLDAKGRQKQRYSKTTKVVEAPGKKAAERLLETWIAELESHRTIDPDRLQLAELLDRWLEATRGEMRVASYNSYKRIRRLHVDPALGQAPAGEPARLGARAAAGRLAARRVAGRPRERPHRPGGARQATAPRRGGRAASHRTLRSQVHGSDRGAASCLDHLDRQGAGCDAPAGMRDNPVRSRPLRLCFSDPGELCCRCLPRLVLGLLLATPECPENEVDDRGGIVLRKAPVGDEAAVEGGPYEEVEDHFQVGVGGDFATPDGLVEDVPHGLPASFRELSVQVPQGGVAFRSVDEGGHESGVWLRDHVGLESLEQVEKIASQSSRRGHWENAGHRVHGIDEHRGRRRPMPVERGLAGPGAAGDCFHSQPGQALVGEHLECSPKHAPAGVLAATDRRARRGLARNVTLTRLLRAAPGGFRLAHRNVSVSLFSETGTYR
jgi:hypothetical protein